MYFNEETGILVTGGKDRCVKVILINNSIGNYLRDGLLKKLKNLKEKKLRYN
jgi:hypothetical protein